MKYKRKSQTGCKEVISAVPYLSGFISHIEFFHIQQFQHPMHFVEHAICCKLYQFAIDIFVIWPIYDELELYYTYDQPDFQILLHLGYFGCQKNNVKHSLLQ